VLLTTGVGGGSDGSRAGHQWVYKYLLIRLGRVFGMAVVSLPSGSNGECNECVVRQIDNGIDETSLGKRIVPRKKGSQ